MTYEPFALIENKWESCDTYFEDATEAYNYLVRCVNSDMKIKGIKVVNITTGETEIEEIL